jgi:hypothetical protein
LAKLNVADFYPLAIAEGFSYLVQITDIEEYYRFFHPKHK